MDTVYYILKFLIFFLALIVITRLFMNLANWTGESLGIGNFVIKLLQNMEAFVMNLLRKIKKKRNE